MLFLLKELRIDPRGKKLVLVGNSIDEDVMRSVDIAIKAGSAIGIAASGGIPGYYDPGKCYIDLFTTTYAEKVRIVDIAGPSALTHAIMLSSVVSGPVIVLDKYGPERSFAGDAVLIKLAKDKPLLCFVEVERATPGYMRSPLAKAIAELQKIIDQPLYVEVFSNLSRPGCIILKGPADRVEASLRKLRMPEHEFVLVCMPMVEFQKIIKTFQ